MKWRLSPSGALTACVPELPPQCEQGCPHRFHPQVCLVPEYDRVLEDNCEWTSTTWQVWEKRDTYDVSVVGRGLGLQEAMEAALDHAAGMEGGQLETFSWDGHERGINSILDNVRQEDPEMLRIPEHECSREYRMDVAPDPEDPEKAHQLTACDLCIYPKSALTAYLVVEERHPSATIRRMT